MYKDIDYHNERVRMQKIYENDTMCTAKFFTSTLYLQSGQTHSCYHPLPHQVGLDEIIDNPSAIHNSAHKKKQRKKMLCGDRPEECNYCWRVEDIGTDVLSDRIIKSKNEILLTPNAHEIILENGHEHNYDPTYLEISFGNECNMKCAYCHPKASSAWMKEMDLFGKFESAPHLQILEEKIYPEEENPYVEAFWKWWPDLRKNLKVLRLTGGEPLLQQNTWKFLDMLEETDDCSDMIFQLNTNLNVKNILVQRLVKKMDSILKNKKIKKFALFSSVESWGERAQYARSGLDCDLFEKNVETIMLGLNHYPSTEFSGIQIMNTFNIMCVTSYTAFLKKILEWREKFTLGRHKPYLSFDIPHCTEPNHWTLVGLPDEYAVYFEETTKFIYKHSWVNNWNKYPAETHDFYYGKYFSEEEQRAWDRVIKVWESIVEGRAKIDCDDYLEPRQVDDARRNWFLFIKETDARRGTNFLDIFPEMEPYYKICAGLEDIENMSYNQSCKDEMVKLKNTVEIHWDDDFVWHYPALANNIVELRKSSNAPTELYYEDKLTDKFGIEE